MASSRCEITERLQTGRRALRSSFDHLSSGYAEDMTDIYTLPDLPYAYDALAPWCPADTMKLHHGKHHATYVKEANALTTQLAAVDPTDEVKLGALQAAFSFNLSGHLLHSLFWTSIRPESGRPPAALASRIKENFGSFERFTALFTSACVKVQGSGWGALMIDPATGALRVGSILNHTSGLAPGTQLMAVVDVWEHAYYLTHKNDRATWVGAAIEHLDWEAIALRCDEAAVSVPVPVAVGA